MDFAVGSEVECTDGQGGHLERIVMDPESERITHLVIRLGWFAPRDVVVPLDKVTKVDERTVYLSISKAELEGMPGFLEEHFVSPSRDWNPPPNYPRQTVLWLTTPVDFEGDEYNLFGTGFAEYQPLFVEETENVPAGSVVIAKGMAVEATDGEVGHVTEVVTAPNSINVQSLIVHSELGDHENRQIPVDQLDRVEEDRLFLRITTENFTKLPAHPLH
ncbi:MAG: PRC-barrel domain-containing protein [Chloroflexi bacterium]|nr:PRC-barrel domain-containing protein [Chloroflexota bacterium]